MTTLKIVLIEGEDGGWQVCTACPEDAPTVIPCRAHPDAEARPATEEDMRRLFDEPVEP